MSIHNTEFRQLKKNSSIKNIKRRDACFETEPIKPIIRPLQKEKWTVLREKDLKPLDKAVLKIIQNDAEEAKISPHFTPLPPQSPVPPPVLSPPEKKQSWWRFFLSITYELLFSYVFDFRRVFNQSSLLLQQKNVVDPKQAEIECYQNKIEELTCAIKSIKTENCKLKMQLDNLCANNPPKTPCGGSSSPCPAVLDQRLNSLGEFTDTLQHQALHINNIVESCKELVKKYDSVY